MIQVQEIHSHLKIYQQSLVTHFFYKWFNKQCEWKKHSLFLLNIKSLDHDKRNISSPSTSQHSWSWYFILSLYNSALFSVSSWSLCPATFFIALILSNLTLPSKSAQEGKKKSVINSVWLRKKGSQHCKINEESRTAHEEFLGCITSKGGTTELAI